MDQPEEQSPAAAAYFPVSCTKLVAMSICTVGIYQVVWAWRCWEYIRYRDGRRLNPFWRSVYISTLFFNFLLFWDIYRSSGHSKLTALGWSLLLGFAYVGLWICGPLFEGRGLWAITLLSFLVLIPVQRQINKFNEAEHPDCDPNRGFSWVNIAAVVIGGLVVLSALANSFSPPS